MIGAWMRGEGNQPEYADALSKQSYRGCWLFVAGTQHPVVLVLATNIIWDEYDSAWSEKGVSWQDAEADFR